ncbi:hypothetical protein ACFWJT_27645, partial [Streptomyces sp. NPDC127069]
TRALSLTPPRPARGAPRPPPPRHDIKEEDAARLSTLKGQHINFLGRYLFTIKASGPGQGLRPLRDPDAAHEDVPEKG